jgi:hypothetical protein
VEVATQLQPLMALCVLEHAAAQSGIVIRLETCPAQSGVSWLTLESIGRVPVSRVGGLVLIGYEQRSDGTICLGSSFSRTALIDTGAQVCLFSSLSGMRPLERTVYSGPTLRGADDALVDCVSAANFRVLFSCECMLPTTSQRACKVTTDNVINEARVAHIDGALSACAVSRAPPSHPGRFTHAKKLRGAEEFNARFGVTDPAVFKALATSALGVESFAAPHARITSLAFVQQASRRTAIRKAKVERERPLPGTSASLDFTREFTRDVDGNIVAAVFLDIATYSLFVFQLPGKSGLDAAKAVRAYRAHVRGRAGGMLASNSRICAPKAIPAFLPARAA